MVVAIMVIVCGWHGLWPSLSNPIGSASGSSRNCKWQLAEINFQNGSLKRSICVSTFKTFNNVSDSCSFLGAYQTIEPLDYELHTVWSWWALPEFLTVFPPKFLTFFGRPNSEPEFSNSRVAFVLKLCTMTELPI